MFAQERHSMNCRDCLMVPILITVQWSNSVSVKTFMRGTRTTVSHIAPCIAPQGSIATSKVTLVWTSRVLYCVLSLDTML